MKVNKYIIEAFKNLGKDQKDIVKDLGKSQPYVSALMNGKKSVGRDVARELEQLYGFDYASVLSGEFPTTSEDSSNIVKPESEIQRIKDGIPLIPIDAMAGFAVGSSQIMKYDTKEYIVPEFTELKVEFMIRVSGSSMYPKYSSGDLLACKKIDKSFFQWNKVYVLDTKQGALVKRVWESDKKGCIKCVSDNKDYPPFDIPIDEINAIAIVLGVIRRE